MSVRNLNRRIVLRLWSDVPNDAFGLDQAVDAGMDLWSEVEPIHGIAMRYGAQTGEAPTHLFWVRYGGGTRPEDITAGHVIEWKERRYRVIDAINVDDRNRFTRIATKDLGEIA